MGLIEAVILALIQGITEFLPISSSAHLILLPKLTGLPDQGLAFDVALHTATSLAICIYLRGDLKVLLSGLFASFQSKGAPDKGEGALAWKIIAATIPVAIIGVLAHDVVSTQLRTVEVIAISSIIWGVVLWVADRRPGMGGIWKDEGGRLGWRAAIFIGLAQALSLVPGTSRSGITITAGLFMGLTRSAAARFAFLLSVPVGIMAGVYETTKLMKGGVEADWALIAVGFIFAFLSAYLIIHLFLKMVQSFSSQGLCRPTGSSSGSYYYCSSKIKKRPPRF